MGASIEPKNKSSLERLQYPSLFSSINTIKKWQILGTYHTFGTIFTWDFPKATLKILQATNFKLYSLILEWKNPNFNFNFQRFLCIQKCRTNKLSTQVLFLSKHNAVTSHKFKDWLVVFVQTLPAGKEDVKGI